MENKQPDAYDNAEKALAQLKKLYKEVLGSDGVAFLKLQQELNVKDVDINQQYLDTQNQIKAIFKEIETLKETNESNKKLVADKNTTANARLGLVATINANRIKIQSLYEQVNVLIMFVQKKIAFDEAAKALKE